MNRNEGNVDRALRVVAGVGLVGATLAGLIGPWGWLGVVAIATGLLGSCPLYAALGINTCPMKRA